MFQGPLIDPTTRKVKSTLTPGATNFFKGLLVSDGSVVFSTDPLFGYLAAVPRTASGAIRVTANAPTHFAMNAYPINDADKALCVSEAPVSHVQNGIPYTASGAIAVTTGAPP